MIELEQVSFAYTSQTKAIFKNLNLGFKLGKKYFITGSNGSGKSTLLKLIAQQEKPAKGRIIINQKEEFKAPKHAYFSQDLGLFPHLTIEEHLCLFSKIIPDATKAKELATKLHLQDVLHEYVAEISKGQQVKLALTLNLYFNPQIILLDEPTNALDADSIKVLFEQFDRIWQVHQGQALFVIVSHQTDLFQNYCDEFINIESITSKNKTHAF